MNDDDKWGWDDEDWEEYERKAEEDAKLRAAFLGYQRAEIARNRRYGAAIQTEAALVELHIYELIEELIEDNAAPALAAFEQARAALDRAAAG